ncbi:phosphatase and actin regulator 1 isoform 3 [Loa loa]|uniref:Phosphatase and actin regulator 1 isoform 3 n=1 Tax=Loa loa TaxID=7209 RepID=A0A1S0TSW9_LOALO|nr:phosphatase and actin regulator 1 isoform 3 [Loa loa]EFO18932.2 phosphatase and actin regulator 1 isoform 3 [Loa loa]
MLKSQFETKVNIQKETSEFKKIEVFEQTSENVAAANVEFSPNRTTNKSRYCRRKHSYHVFSSSLKSGKFWLRIFRPWKWRKRRNAERLRRGTSDHRRENSPPAIIRSSFSALESPFSVPDETYRPTQWNSLNSSTQEPVRILDSLKGGSSAGNILHLTTEEILVQPVQKVVIVEHKNTSSACNLTNIKDVKTNTGHLTVENLIDFEAASIATQAEQLGQERASINGKQFTDQEYITFQMDPREIKSAVVEEIVAKEPDLSARPNKPVLKKPGAPSRFRLVKRTPSQKIRLSERISGTVGIDRPNQPLSSNRTELPSRLTDDSDSDTDIQYRDDELGKRHSIGYSTNPAIASRIVSYPLSSEDDEDVPLTSFALRVTRKDTFAKTLNVRDPVDDIPNQTSDDRLRLMHKASIKLERKLSERPSVEELEQRNILRAKDASISSKMAMDETRKVLLRKLSFRPTIQELKDKQIIKFNDYVEVTEAEAYDRKADKPWTRLTPVDKALIRKELNDFKATEMDVHEESRIFTRFHRP